MRVKLRTATGIHSEQIIKHLFDEALEGDLNAITAIFDRVVPKLPPQHEKTDIGMSRVDLSLYEKAEFVVDAVLSGQLSASVAETMLRNIKQACEIQEHSEILERLEALENANKE